MTSQPPVCARFALSDLFPPPPSSKFYTIVGGDVHKWRIKMFGGWVKTGDLLGRLPTRDDIGRRVYKRANVLVPETDLQWEDRLDFDWARRGQLHFSEHP